MYGIKVFYPWIFRVSNWTRLTLGIVKTWRVTGAEAVEKFSFHNLQFSLFRVAHSHLE